MQGRSTDDPTSADYHPAFGATGSLLPVVTWQTPRRVLKGTTLTSTQLNAYANVSGTFLYDSGLGTTPPEGSRTLRVTFYPSDPLYAQVTKTVTLTVDPRPSMTLSPSTTRRFNGNRDSNGNVVGITPAQFVTVSFNNPGNEGWSANATVPWITLPNRTGAGAGLFSIAVDPVAFKAAFPTENSATALVTVTADPLTVTEDTRTQTIAVQVEGAPQTSGFGLLTTLAPGTYEITSYVWMTRTGRFEDARTVTLVVR